MIGASYVFYGWWNWRYVFLLAGVSAIAQLAGMAVSRQEDQRRRMRVMAVGVAATIAPLLYFKYYGFFTVNAANAGSALGLHVAPPLIQVVLPIGVSFYTFMAISYVVDIYRRRFEVASWSDVFLYLSFFPHLVAGPIVRPNELIPQIDVRHDPRNIDVVGAGWLILGGLFKKIVIANYLAGAIVDPVFGDPSRHSGLEAVVGIVGVRGPDLLRLQRLHGHRDRRREAPRLPVPAELRPAVQRALRAGVLAALAHDAVPLVARLPLHPARRQPEGHRADLREPDDHDAARRPVARRRLALRGLGRAARCLPRGRPLEAGETRCRSARGATRHTPGGVDAATDHVRARVHRVDVVPRRLRGHRADPARQDDHGRGGSHRRWSRCP